MITYHFLNTTGLLLSMIGVAILFRFGPPQPSFDEGIALGLEDANEVDDKGTTVAEYNEQQRKKRRLYTTMSRIGLGLVFVGFAFQLAATYAN